MNQVSFDPDVPPEKKEPLQDALQELLTHMEMRLEEYEKTRSDIHWKDDDAYRHIEKAYGEFALAYAVAKEDSDNEKLLRELADGMNHILMAADIGPDNIDLDENGKRFTEAVQTD